jgi:hypothetical protein
MKMKNKTALILGALVLAATTATADPVGKQVDTLHFAIRSPLSDQGVEAGSSGNVSANEVRQRGVVNAQKLDVSVSGLTANTTYSLVATTGGGTTDLEDFDTDNNGRATLHLSSSKNGKVPKNATALPDGFELAQVSQLQVVNGGSQAVLSTTDATPTSATYSIKRTLNGDAGETGVLQINASTKKTKFTLNAAGLTPDTDYNLVFNGEVVQTNTTDSKGRLKIKSAPTPDNIVNLGSVQLQDTSGTPILSTTLP